MTKIVIWHNPRCSKSREALKLLDQKGVEPEIRPYLADPPSADEIRDALKKLDLRPIEMMRTKEKKFRELGLNKDDDDETLIQAMVENPVLIERPIVFAGDRAAIGRPPEAVLEIL